MGRRRARSVAWPVEWMPPRLAPTCTSAFVTVTFDDKKRNSGDSVVRVRVRGFHEDLCHTDTIMPGFSTTLCLNAVEVPM